MGAVIEAEVSGKLAIPISAGKGTYLGLPYMVGRSKKQILQYIKDRLWKKVRGWKEKFRSQAGQDVLIKAILLVIPTFVMSCFYLPKTLSEEINAMIRRFWWSNGQKDRPINWSKWEDLCKSKA